MIAPFDTERNLLADARPMQQILEEISAQLAEAKLLKAGGPLIGSA